MASASSKVAEGRLKAHDLLLALEQLVETLEFHLTIIEEELAGEHRPLAQRALDQIRAQLVKLERMRT
jgi:hypothetical protein